MGGLALVLMLLLPGQADRGGDISPSPKEILRMQLQGVLRNPTVLNFDVPPLYELQTKCDLPGTLIDILQEEARTSDKEQQAISAIKVLDLYWKKFPDARIPLVLGSYCVDQDRPILVRTEALQKRGLMPGDATPAFYADVLRNDPDIAGILVSYLDATAEKLFSFKWMSIQELYTPEVRSALEAYIQGRLRIPSLFPQDRKRYESMIADFDRAAGLSTKSSAAGDPSRMEPSRSTSHPSNLSPGRPDKLPQLPIKGSAPSSSALGTGRCIAAALVATGVLAILMYRFIRRT